jgi:DNA-binding transcriptional ArsR family regulator
MAVSQYEVLVHVVSEALGGYWPAPSDGWRSVASEDRRVDLRPLRVLHPASRRTPEWIAPIQDAGETALGETLRRVRMTPPDAVAAELAAMYPGGLPPELRPFVTTPTAALERFARAVEDFWDKHVRLRWPTIKSIVDREVLVTSAALMTKPEALNRVHPRFSFGADEVVLRGCGRVVRASVGARTVLLVPTVAADDALIVHLDEPDVLQVGYAARGGAELWSDEPARHEREFSALLGDSRAHVLAALRRPATTSALAARLHSSPANISFHLQALARMGLVDKTRRGRRVYYRTTPRGAALIALFLDPA